MPELRRDPLTGRWVIIAGERGARPSDFPHGKIPKGKDEGCPFCFGAEAMTPPEVYAIREPNTSPDSPGWRVRVVPNKFPALKAEPGATGSAGLFEAMPAQGVHEVVIHGPDHDLSLGEMTDDEVTQVLRAYAARFGELADEDGVRHIMAVINYGKESGASLAHPHSQLLALPLVPEAIEREIEMSHNAQTAAGECLMCSVIRGELENGSRVVVDHDDYLLFAPYASRMPFELLLAPKKHCSNFEDIPDADVPAMANGVRLALDVLNRVLDDPPYNLVLHSGPVGAREPGFHWHAEVIPRLTTLAGFEAGSGVFINTLAPEAAAEILRTELV